MKKSVIFTLISIILLCSCTTLKLNKLSDTYIIMDTPCTITAGGKDKSKLKAAISSAFDRVYEIEAYTDYYSNSSDVSLINKADKNQPITVSDDMINILQTALEICKKSNGAFDITIAPIKDIWGFRYGSHPPPSDTEIKLILPFVDYNNIIIDAEQKTVTKKNTITRIDLGGCAKGYAADEALKILKEFQIEYALIDFGGNILTYGKNPSNPNGQWTIGIQKPFSKTGEYSETVSVTDKAVVTSGTYQRYFEYENKIYHHIINPKTGYPTDNNIDSVTITSDSALVADCLSTACMVLSEDNAEALTSNYNAEINAITTQN